MRVSEENRTTGDYIAALGNTNSSDKVYYNNSDTEGLKDYALITDNSHRDVIQLKGLPSDYHLEPNFTVGSNTGTGIFLVSEQNDLIGIVAGVVSLELNSNNFKFV